MEKRDQKNQDKKDLIGIFKRTIKGYFRNLYLSIPSFVLAIITIILVILSTYASSRILQGIEANPLNSISKTNAALFLFLIIIFFLILIYSGSFLISGTIGMAAEINEKKKSSLLTAIKTGNKFWLRFLGSSIITLLISSIVFLILVFGANLIVKNLSATIQTITIILIVFLTVLVFVWFMLIPYIVIIRGIGVFRAVKESINFAKKHYLDLFVITSIFVIIGALIEFIPYTGELINIIIIIPIQILTIVTYLKVYA